MVFLEAFILSESAAPQDGDLHGSKVSGIGSARHQVNSVALGQRRVFDDDDQAVSAPALARSSGDQASRLNAGEGANPFDRTVHERNLLDSIFVSCVGQAEMHG